MKEDKIYRTDVELYAAAQPLGRDLYIYQGMGSTKSNGSNSHAVRKGYMRGGKAFTLDNRFGMGTDGHFNYVLSTEYFKYGHQCK